MPVIAFVSPKGGVGKTTACLVLACEIVRAGGSVSILDADPNQPIAKWSEGAATPDALRIIGGITADNSLEHIDAERDRSAFVLIDLEGTRNELVTFAASRADLVIIPAQGSQLDMDQAAVAIAAVKRFGQMCRRDIPYRVLLTRTSAAVRGRTLRHIEKEIAGAGVPCFRVQLMEREAYKALFSVGCTLGDLRDSDTGGLKGARENAESFAAEVISALSGPKDEERAA